MAELQQGLWIVKTEERYEPTFSYRWDLLERWLPERVAEGRRLSRAAAVERLVGSLPRRRGPLTPRRAGPLLALPRREVEAAVARLEARGRVAVEAASAGARHRVIVSADGGTRGKVRAATRGAPAGRATRRAAGTA